MVYIKTYNKDIFPLYLSPMRNELFSSWISRLSINHQVKTQTFYKNFFSDSQSYFTRDIDILSPPNLIETISKHTPLSLEDINSLFLKSYEGYAFEKIKTDTTTINILPIGMVKRSIFKYGLQACVKCLNEHQYFQKQWRLSTSIICAECRLYLIDRCPKCEHPLHFFKINKGGNGLLPTKGFLPFNICYNCLYDFKLIELKSLAVHSHSHLQYQNFINATISNGYNKMTNYSFLFIKVFLIIATRLRKDSQKEIFRKFVKEFYAIDLETSNENINFWNLQKRITTFPIVHSLIKDENFFEQLNKCKIAKSYIFSEKSGLPYWFEKRIIY